MILHSPFQISPRLLPALRVGDAWIQLEYSTCAGRDGRKRYRYTIDLPDGSSFSDDDLQSGAGGGTLQEGFSSLLSFLCACGESYDYPRPGDRQGDNVDLFPPRIAEWCAQNSDDLGVIAYELDACDGIGSDDPRCLIEE